MNISQITNFIQQNAELAWFYLPLGIIGIWRWSVWIIRKFISFFYRTPKGTYSAILSLVTPVYNEDPKLFRRAIESWAENGVDEIIAVIDYSDKINIKIFEEFQADFSGARLIITPKPGKRPALADGIRASSGEIIALVDSDTVWSTNIKNKLLGPFADPSVGGVVSRQDVFETDTLARKLFKILLDDRYLFEYPFLATVSDALLCLSGRTALYRRSAIIDKLYDLENDTFWGQKMISGDDKTLTRLIHADGWTSRYVKGARVYTSGTSDTGGFMKQKLRWTRNGLRSDSKAFFSRWLWRDHKILALHMLDKFISPLTLLLSPIFFTLALYFGHWQVALIILIWWIVSRTVKIFPHLRENPGDILILPQYILMTFVMAAVKLYAFITIDEQGWITRWDKARFAPINFFRKLTSYVATGTLIFGLFFVIFSYKNAILRAAQIEKQQKQVLGEATSSIFTPNMLRTSDSDLEMMKNSLASQNKRDPYGYYVVKQGDTVATLRRRFNLSSAGKILNAQTKTPVNFVNVGQKIAIPVADLRNPIVATIAPATGLTVKPPRVTYDAPTNTIFVRQGGSVARLINIKAALGPANQNLLTQTSPGEWILRANLYVGKNVTLILDGSEVKYLKLKSDADGFVWVRSQSGSILINNTKITSWDEKNNAPDLDYEKGRAYITAKSSSRMDIINSDLGYLGYAGLPNRGGPFGGSYGVSWKNENGNFRDELLVGTVLDNKFHHNYFGFYTFGATGMLVRGNEAYENIQYGFDPHDDSNNMLIENNQAYRNGNHGIIISRRCFDNVISGNVSHDNHLHGIMIDRDSNNNLVQGNTVYGNVDGIAVYGSNNNLVLENEVHDNVRGVRLNAGSTGNYFANNNIIRNSRGVYVYDRAEKNIFLDNQVKSNEIGVALKDASHNQFYDNFKLSDNKKDGRVAGDSRENNIQ